MACPFLTLPDELHLRILDFSDWQTAVKLGQTCTRFRDLCQEGTFWQRVVQQSFPMHVDNVKKYNNWPDTFKALITGRLYGWGRHWDTMFTASRNNHSQFHRVGQQFHRRDAQHNRLPRDSLCAWPTLLEDKKFQGVADVQSGGWSICLLTLSGSIIIGGSLDGASALAARSPRTIRFPVPDVRINQISCGRSHLLALSDNGEIWCVRGSRITEEPALIQPVELLGNRRLVKKVVAGWNASAALVEGYGIIMWFDEHPDESQPGTPSHVRTISMKDIPYLSYLNTAPASMKYCQEDPVVDFAIGERHLVAVTASGRVYGTKIQDVQNGDQIAPMEFLQFRAPSGQPPISRVEGKFRRFALFNSNGLVHLTEDADRLDTAFNTARTAAGSRCHDLNAMRTDAVSPLVVEELTKHNIVDVAFGDWHYLALTDTGKVLSWGTECQGCGSLGLGPADAAERRGVRRQFNGDSLLMVPQIISFDHPYAENGDAHDGKKVCAYKISAGGWHSCALLATVEKNTLPASGASPQSIDGCPESKEYVEAPEDENSTAPPKTQVDLPKTERGHRGGIIGMQSDARGMQGGLAEGTMAKGGQSIFGTPGRPRPSNEQPVIAGPVPRTERGHRGGIIGMESEARGATGGMAEGTMARGGNSFFGLTGGALQLGKDDSLSASRTKNGKKKRPMEEK